MAHHSSSFQISGSSSPERHTLSLWITFSAFADGRVTVAQAQALERPSDPFDEIAYLLGGNRMDVGSWEATLTSPIRRVIRRRSR